MLLQVWKTENMKNSPHNQPHIINVNICCILLQTFLISILSQANSVSTMITSNSPTMIVSSQVAAYQIETEEIPDIWQTFKES